MEYIKPLVMLVAGAATVMLLDIGDASALLYPVLLAIELAFGLAGLWLACKLYVGGAGPLGLAVLRLAGIYAATDVIAMLADPLGALGLIIHLLCFVGLLAWLFDFDPWETVVVLVVTFLLKIVASAAVIGFLIGAA